MEEIPLRHDNTNGSQITMDTPRSGGLKRSRDEQMGPGGKERRTRTIFNLAQINALERIFMDVEYPDGDLKAKLAHRLEVDENTVQIWFQNRRAKKKRLQRGQPLPNTGDQFHHHQVLSQPGHLLPISDRQNYLHVTAEGRIHVQSVPGNIQCYSTSSMMMMGHPEPAIHWAGKTHLNSMDHYAMDPNRIPSLQTRNSPIALTKENSSAIDLSKASSNIRAAPSPARSVQSPTLSEGGVIDQIRKWPVKEPPTSRSAFGKLDFPKLPRVCIRHDSAQMRSVPNGVLGASSPVSKGGHRDIAKLRMNVLKKDPPKSPPPNQTCAAIPRSQRNELELALMKHGLAEETSEVETNRFGSGHRSGYISDDWSSSSEESSDSEGLAPPRRRRKVLRDRQKPPPNISCASVPLHDRTLPYLSKIPQYSSEKVPSSQSVATPPPTTSSKPSQSFEISLNNDNLSDWDTDSDDSSWAYFDQGPTKETGNKDSPQTLLDLHAGQYGPQSAPPALVPVEDSDANTLTNGMDNERAGNVANCTDDEFSEITLAREFAEMLPSPLGSYLPIYHEEPSSSNQGCEPYRRPRIHSDSALITTRTESRIQPHADTILRNSPASTQSSDSSLSGLSSLFSIPVSPSELVKQLSDDVAGINQSPTFETQGNPRLTGSNRQHPDGLTDVGQQGMLQNCQLLFMEDDRRPYGQQSQTGSASMKESLGRREANSFLMSDTKRMDYRHLQQSNVRSNASLQGIIRPIPTRPLQATSSPPNQSNIHAPSATTHVNNTVAFSDRSSAIPVASLQQGATYDQHQMQGNTNLNYSGPGFQETGPSSPLHPQVDVHPHTVVHHQPSSMFASQHPPRWPGNAYGADVPRHPTSAPPHNVSFSLTAPHQAAVGVSSTSNDNLPPNQVCTVVPDAVSSQGLMARYLAWTQGRTLER